MANRKKEENINISVTKDEKNALIMKQFEVFKRTGKKPNLTDLVLDGELKKIRVRLQKNEEA